MPSSAPRSSSSSASNGGSSSGQLLQELEALSQALYQSQNQHQQAHGYGVFPSSPPPPQFPSPSRLPSAGADFKKQQQRSIGRRYSSSSTSSPTFGHGASASHLHPVVDGHGIPSLAQHPIPLAASADPYPSTRNRHSISATAPLPNLIHANKPLFPPAIAMTTAPPPAPSATPVNSSSPNVSAEQQLQKKNSDSKKQQDDIRSRIDRRLSLQLPWQQQQKSSSSTNKTAAAVAVAEEDDLDPPEVSRRHVEDHLAASAHKKKLDHQATAALTEKNPKKSSTSSATSSVWNWKKPLRALSHIGRHRLHCVFTAHVHAIQGLPAMMSGLRLCVHLRKEETKEGAVQTMPSRIFQGMAEFEEKLMLRCTLYRNNNNKAQNAQTNSSAASYGGHGYGSSSNNKFMEKSVIVSVVSPDIEELDFGKHQLDLSSLLSDLVDDSNGQIEKERSWDTTALDLTGKAKGAKLMITFHYEMIDNNKQLESSSGGHGSISSRFVHGHGHGHGSSSPPHHLRSSSSSSSRMNSSSTSFSLPNSAHSSPRIMTKNSGFYSPAISEPGDDYNKNLIMDHLSLDDHHHHHHADPDPDPPLIMNPKPAAAAPAAHILNDHQPPPPPPLQQALNPAEDTVVASKPPASAASSTSPTPAVINQKEEEPSSENDDDDDYDAEFCVVELHEMDIHEAAAVNVPPPTNSNDAVKNSTIPATDSDDAVKNSTIPAATDSNDAAKNSTILDTFDIFNPAPHSVSETTTNDASAPDVISMDESDWNEEKETRRLEDDDDDDDEKVNNEEASGNIDPYHSESGTGSINNKVLESSPISESKIDEPKLSGDEDIVAKTDEGEDKKEEDVTYQTVMKTLDSLLQGTSAKEQLKEEEEEKEKEAMVDLTEIIATDDGEDYLKEKQGIIHTSPSSLTGSRTFDDETPEDLEDTIHGKDLREETLQIPQDIDSEADLVAGEFLDMLDSGDMATDKNYESEQDSSPRARLLKQFEQESLGFGLDLGIEELLLDQSSPDDLDVEETTQSSVVRHTPSADDELDVFHSSSLQIDHDSEEREEQNIINGAAKPQLPWATQSIRSKTRAKLLEDAETEALMQEMGLDEKAFSTPPTPPKIKQQEPPPLGRGLGASVPLKDGGSLRSMSPSHFQASKGNSGKLVMQMSQPVVIPADMGSEAVDILRNMVSMGVENMAVQAMTSMPLEDIAGRPMEQVAMEGMEAAKSRHKALMGPVSGGVPGKELQWNAKKPSYMKEEYVSLEDLAPMAVQQIEALALDGLKIQSNVEENEAPSAVDAFSLGEQIEEMVGNNRSSSVTGVHLHKGLTGGRNDDGSGMMDMAISLDEWMLLDAGLYDEGETNKNAMAIMAAHQANHHHGELTVVDEEEDRKGSRKQNAKGKWGYMGNTVTIAMLVQLRDPLKNNEAVGVPMMAFVQAERMMKPPKMKVGRNVSLKGNTEEEEEENRRKDSVVEAPQFKVIQVHMAGIKTTAASDKEEEAEEQGSIMKKKWVNPKQQQTASRWLLANGMSKTTTKSHHPLLTSKPSSSSSSSTASTKDNRGDSLWSISSKIHESSSKWKSLHKRNPDVVYRGGRRF